MGEEIVQRINTDATSSVVLVCEHASNVIPARFGHLGLLPEHRQSHAVWDPSAMAVARRLSDRLDAALVAGAVSRLVYDCNRPPEAPDAMPARSEVIDVPGNARMTPKERAERVQRYYMPFRKALSDQIAGTQVPVIVTVHSFTPVYNGQTRAVEIGLLHDADARLADAMLSTAGGHTTLDVQRNQPYGPEHGVTHTLKQHALPGGHLNVMLEIRNDLIRTGAEQIAMADMIAGWLVASFARTRAEGDVRCVA